MENKEITEIELDLMLEAVYRRYGYDFRSYARSMLKRRSVQFLSGTGCRNFSEATGMLLRDPGLFQRLITCFSITVTEMFRDPVFYLGLREKVVPMLRTWHHFKIWHAGCATGEEAYSLAILLEEEGLYDRAGLYATDISQVAIDTARAGIYDMKTIRQGSLNHRESGGSGSFARHYHARYNAAVLNQSLKRCITFATHNLAMDSAFGEMQAIICRNVLIYFNQDLKDRILRMFAECLANGGFLCLGNRESLEFSAVSDVFETVDREARIYKKKAVT